MNRIVQIGPYPLSNNSGQGGVEASVIGLSYELSKEYEVHVFDVPRIGIEIGVEEDGKVIVHRFCNRANHHLMAAASVKKVARDIVALKPDMCHIHGTSLYAWLVFRNLKKAHLPVVVTVHGLACVEKRNALRKRFTIKRLIQLLYQGWVERHFLKQLPSMIVDTEYVRDKVKGYSMRHRPVIRVIPQGVREVFFSINGSPDSRMLLSVGAISERKGHLITLKAFEQVRKNGINTSLVIAGVVSDQSYLENLRKAIDNSEFNKDVSLCLNVGDDYLIELYKKARLFVLHSEEESQGIVFLEAMAAGLPVVATEVGGVPYVVRHKETGLLSRYGCLKDFADNMQRLLVDEDLWEQYSMASRNVAQSYHWDGIAKMVKLCY